jgi:hypothetical protein
MSISNRIVPKDCGALPAIRELGQLLIGRFVPAPRIANLRRPSGHASAESLAAAATEGPRGLTTDRVSPPSVQEHDARTKRYEMHQAEARHPVARMLRKPQHRQKTEASTAKG